MKLDTVEPMMAAARSISALASGLVRRLMRADSFAVLAAGIRTLLKVKLYVNLPYNFIKVQHTHVNTAYAENPLLPAPLVVPNTMMHWALMGIELLLFS